MPDIKHVMSPIRLKWTDYSNRQMLQPSLSHAADLPYGPAFSHQWLPSSSTSITHGLRAEPCFCLGAGTLGIKQECFWVYFGPLNWKAGGPNLALLSWSGSPGWGGLPYLPTMSPHTRPQPNLRAACGQPCIATSQTTKAP